MSALQKSVARSLFQKSLLQFDYVSLVYVLAAFFSQLESAKGSDWLGLLQDAVDYRVEMGRWPSPDDEFGLNVSQHWISPGGLRFTLYRRWNGNHQYWYMYRYFPNGRKHWRYVGKNIKEEKLLQINKEYLALLPMNSVKT